MANEKDYVLKRRRESDKSMIRFLSKTYLLITDSRDAVGKNDVTQGGKEARAEGSLPDESSPASGPQSNEPSAIPSIASLPPCDFALKIRA